MHFFLDQCLGRPNSLLAALSQRRLHPLSNRGHHMQKSLLGIIPLLIVTAALAEEPPAEAKNSVDQVPGQPAFCAMVLTNDSANSYRERMSFRVFSGTPAVGITLSRGAWAGRGTIDTDVSITSSASKKPPNTLQFRRQETEAEPQYTLSSRLDLIVISVEVGPKTRTLFQVLEQGRQFTVRFSAPGEPSWVFRESQIRQAIAAFRRCAAGLGIELPR
jgi:hypothetical protein